MTAKFKRIVEVFKEGGLDKLLDVVAWNVPHWLFYYNHSVLVTSDLPSWEATPQPECVIRFLTQDDMCLLQQTGLNHDVARERLLEGDQAVIAIKDGQILTIIWATARKRFLRLSGSVFDPGANGSFYYGSYTNSRARMKGLFSTARLYIHKYYSDLGRWKNWGAINANDKPWLAAVLNRNYSIAGETYYFKVMFLNVCYYKFWPHPTKKLHVYIKVPPNKLYWV